jgi:sugar/nucleoside kinase (ribokinase family)
MNKQKNILAVGSIAIDTLETPMGNCTDVLGGSASYFSVAASMLAPVKVVGVVGNDYPEKGWKMFKSRNINVDNVQIAQGKTFRWGGKYNNDYSSRETLFTDLGVFESFSPNIRQKDCGSPLVFLGNIQPDLQLVVADTVCGPEYIVSDTMNLWIDQFPEKLGDVIKRSSIFLINHEEAEQLTGKADVVSAAHDLINMGPRAVVIKMGAGGSYVSYNNGGVFVPVFPVKEVLDPTGAGDSFAGGFMGYLSQTQNPDFIEAVIMGSAMASFCVEGFGMEALLRATTASLYDRIKIIKNSMSKEIKI